MDSKWSIEANGTAVTLRSIAGQESITLNAEELDGLVRQLWAHRLELSPEISRTVPKTIHWRGDPNWYPLETSDGKLPVLALRHDGAGWLGFAFPLNEAQAIANWLISFCRLRRPKTVEEKVASLPSTASAISGPNFLISTHGFGSFYYGSGDQAIGVDPFEQMEADSDRAAAIVGGAIVEHFLNGAVTRARVGSVGSQPRSARRETFGGKISFARQIGLVSDEAHRDLISLKAVRNAFAHELRIDAFDEPSVQELCNNLLLVDQRVGPVTGEVPELEPNSSRRSFAQLTDYESKIKNPRFRYVTTCQIFAFELGMRPAEDSKSFPVI